MSANNPFQQPTNKQNMFATVPQANIKRSLFNLSHSHKGTIWDAGLLQPIDLYEVYPGDTFKIVPTVFIRATTQIAPLMDNLYADVFYFWVPNRQVWTNWKRFMGERDPDPDSSIDYTIPQLVSDTNGWGENSLPDAYGIGMYKTGKTVSTCAFPTRGYNHIWNNWFRSQDLSDSVVVDLDDGPDTYSDYSDLLRRTKRPDYFTSALPNPQKGTAVALPLGGTVPVTGIGVEGQTFGETNLNVYETDGSGTVQYAKAKRINPSGNAVSIEEDPSNTGYPNIEVDLSAASGSTINDFRESLAIQRVLEKDQRSGSRYWEMIQAHFGVVDPASLVADRPEFLGGSSTPFTQSAVPQTTYQGTATRFDAKGALAANSIFVTKKFTVVKSATEHGYIHGICNIRADISYQQGIDRHWLRRTRYDYYLPAFAHLGEQYIEAQEIYWDGDGDKDATPPTGDYSAWGYVPRFEELRFAKNLVTGTLKSNNVSGTLDHLHLAQDFASEPTLNETFILDDPPIARNLALTPSTTVPAFIFDAYFRTYAARPMPSRSVPGIVGHF